MALIFSKIKIQILQNFFLQDLAISLVSTYGYNNIHINPGPELKFMGMNSGLLPFGLATAMLQYSTDYMQFAFITVHTCDILNESHGVMFASKL